MKFSVIQTTSSPPKRCGRFYRDNRDQDLAHTQSNHPQADAAQIYDVLCRGWVQGFTSRCLVSHRAYNSDFSNLSKGYTFGISTHFRFSTGVLEACKAIKLSLWEKGNRIRMDVLQFGLLPWGNVFTIPFVRQEYIKR
ncbi:hypothetical protein CEXT_485421 [Caerostris extrusa]|uniref:Uncharacterized protein n=1 Tax=Caerostris extrusa TaxID=172846 RepID=A0AAV4Y4X3_CAEEX|nr:hypothetical protein CEXT_485421 [Caerostris extrusa]